MSVLPPLAASSIRLAVQLVSGAVFLFSCSPKDSTDTIWCDGRPAAVIPRRITFGDLAGEGHYTIYQATVVLTGRLSYSLDEIALCPPPGSVLEPVWLDMDHVPDSLHPALLAQQGNIISITGILDRSNKGFLKGYSSTITEIRCISKWQAPIFRQDRCPVHGQR